MLPEKEERIRYYKSSKLGSIRRKSNVIDTNILRREAKRINADISIDTYRDHIEITAQAPAGFVWKHSEEATLIHSLERSDSAYIREAVSQMLEAMSLGYNRLKTLSQDHDEDCECDSCETHDPEVKELSF